MFQARLECFYFGISPGFLLSMATHHINLQISVLGNRSAGGAADLSARLPQPGLTWGPPPPPPGVGWGVTKGRQRH